MHAIYMKLKAKLCMIDGPLFFYKYRPSFIILLIQNIFTTPAQNTTLFISNFLLPFLALNTKMKSMNLFLVTLLIMALAITLSSSISYAMEEPNSNLQGTSQFFLSRKQNRVSLTCDKY